MTTTHSRFQGIAALLLTTVMAACGGGVDDQEVLAELHASAKKEGRPCASSDACGRRKYCTVEDGVCNAPPGCRPGIICPAVCYGTCAPRERPGACRSDLDCRAFSDYCTGCDCRALSVSDPDPTCPGPGVQCFVDPCHNKVAACDAGTCVLRSRL